MTSFRLCALFHACVRWGCLLWVLMGVASVAQAQQPTVLNDHQGSFRLEGSVYFLNDDEGRRSMDDIIKLPRARFTPAATSRSLPLHDGNAIWLRLSLVRDAGSSAPWTLSIPLPYLDYAALYQPDGKGGWSKQAAGDTLAVDSWSRPSLYPEFQLEVPASSSYDVYLELRNFKPTLMPLLLAIETRRDSQRELEHLLLGGLFGALVMLVGVCGIHYLQSRAADDGWYTAYAAGMCVIVSCMTGLSGLWLWPQSPAWSNYTHLSMPILGLSSTLLFVRHIASLDAGFPKLSQAVYAVAGMGVPLALLGIAADRALTDVFNAVYLAVSPALLLIATIQTWRRGHQVGLWLTIAYAPLGLVSVYIGMQMLQSLPAWWQSRYLMVAAVALSVPLLQQALHIRARERREAQERAKALPTQDALTGLLTRSLFDAQVDLAIKRARQRKEPSAIVMVEVVNYSYLRESYGDAVAEQCLLRAAVKLHRVLRDVDPAGRVDTARFGLVLDGVASRQELTERMVRLIASGLIPLPALRPEVTLQFHISCALLTEVVADKRTILQELADMLQGMSPRTRRPIRFLEPAPTMPTSLQSAEGSPSERPGLAAQSKP
ncbi:7TM diverse intracellular signaling domain-containing protein [Rhodoferax sp.]|uniref:sensor domain-containing diguanylate cyclase n=1 Tax=Rhodoferax sp. TaxID=50421 RepID=UPI0025DBB96C|nr:7TM diverse intracellular signaling domain-containing protein [Rhodoferax sp.]